MSKASTPSAPLVARGHPVQGSGALAWNALTPAQREALAPLYAGWDGFSDTRKRKWLAIVGTLPQLPPQERAKLQERMEEWARLSAKERERARLNFAKSKTLDRSDRTAHWEAYQALTEEERRHLAEQAPGRPGVAALTMKPTSPARLVPVPVPVTPHVPKVSTNALLPPTVLDPHTLLVRSANDSVGRP